MDSIKKEKLLLVKSPGMTNEEKTYAAKEYKRAAAERFTIGGFQLDPVRTAEKTKELLELGYSQEAIDYIVKVLHKCPSNLKVYNEFKSKKDVMEYFECPDYKYLINLEKTVELPNGHIIHNNIWNLLTDEELKRL